jgi:ubiquinone/menaquinone biosynthesis C-methylase UbiE
MDREPISHGGVFNNEAFAQEYARKHWKMAIGFGKTYGRRLKRKGFVPRRVLDAGCGFGATNLTLAAQYPDTEFVGIDLSEPLLKMARELAKERGVADRVHFEKADVLEIPFEAGVFDVVLNLNMVHLVEDPRKMLDENERVLAADGILFLADLRRSFLGVLETEIRSALSSAEALNLIRDSNLRAGTFSSGLIWWRYETGPRS